MSDKIYKLANALFHSGALKIGSFKLKSGITSPYYLDLTWLLSSPRDLEYLVNVIAEEIREISSSTRIDRLASIELKGALLLPGIISKVKIPGIVVRKEEKTYGLTGRIAGGEVKKGEHVLFFDDVVTDGRSKMEGIKPLEQMGAKVEVILVVVDREQGGREKLEKMGYQLKSITTISSLIKSLLDSEVISREQAENILKYIDKT